MPLNIKKGDMVVVIRGEDRVIDKKNVRPKRVIRVYPKRRRVVVEGVNMVYKHVRQSKKYPRGGRIEKEAPIDISNVMLWCENCKRPVRTGHKLEGSGETKKKVRVCKKCGNAV